MLCFHFAVVCSANAQKIGIFDGNDVVGDLIPASAGVPKNIAYVYGGEGTINVPSWSPDSKRIAFVSNTQLK